MESQHTERYKFDGVKRGRAVIICNIKYWSDSRYGYRYGADLDLKRMKKMFYRLGFSVKCYKNRTGEEIKDILKTIAELEIKKPTSDCFVCVISSHGEQLLGSTSGGYIKYHNHAVVGVDGEKVETAELINLFEEKNCVPLKGKPKFFFIQACRGDLYLDPNGEEGWDRGVKYQIKDSHQNKGQGHNQGQDTIDRQTSSSDQTTVNEDEYDTSDAEVDSDDDDEDYIFPQLSKQINEAEENNATQFADEKSGQIADSDIGPNENVNQASIHGTVGKSVIGDTIDARDPNAKKEKSDNKERKKEVDVSGVKTNVSNSENVSDSLGIPAKKVPVAEKPVAKVPVTKVPVTKVTVPKEMVNVISLQCFTDMLIMFASPPGKFAIRSHTTGSWMLTTLYFYMKRCDFKLEDKDFLSALLEISGEIAIDLEFEPGESFKNFNGSKTIPCISHMLRSDVYFDDEKLRPKGGLFACLRGSQ